MYLYNLYKYAGDIYIYIIEMYLKKIYVLATANCI